MFTGLIEEIGIVTGIRKGTGSVKLTVKAPSIAPEAKTGESISVNGVCLTAVSVNQPSIEFDAVYETMEKSSLSYLKSGDRVNLERAMRIDGRLDGHMVQGHIDGTGVIREINSKGDDVKITINTTADVMKYVVTKGSIAVDGISLTIADCGDNRFTVAIIPQTLSATTLGDKKAGSIVNLETDIIGRYIYKYMTKTAEQTDRSLMEKLAANGFLE